MTGKKLHLLSAAAVLLLFGSAAASAQDRAGHFGCADIESFLRSAAIGAMRGVPKGVTMPHRATLSDGAITHDAAVQTVDVTKAAFSTRRGSELNMHDFWGYNVAGYELAKLLELNMVPPYVARKVGGNSASLSWWIKAAMDEADRRKQKLEPPDQTAWNQEMSVIRIFNQLIYNTDDNLTNFLITPDWRLWMIDFTRAFRPYKTLQNTSNLTRCDRKLLGRMRALTKTDLEQKLRPYLTHTEIEALLARRDKIVAFFDEKIASAGEAAVMFDLPRSGEPCGTGL